MNQHVSWRMPYSERIWTVSLINDAILWSYKDYLEPCWGTYHRPLASTAPQFLAENRQTQTTLLALIANFSSISSGKNRAIDCWFNGCVLCKFTLCHVACAAPTLHRWAPYLVTNCPGAGMQKRCKKADIKLVAFMDRVICARIYGNHLTEWLNHSMLIPSSPSKLHYIPKNNFASTTHRIFPLPLPTPPPPPHIPPPTSPPPHPHIPTPPPVGNPWIPSHSTQYHIVLEWCVCMQEESITGV